MTFKYHFLEQIPEFLQCFGLADESLVCFRPLVFAADACQEYVVYAWIKFSAVFLITT